MFGATQFVGDLAASLTSHCTAPITPTREGRGQMRYDKTPRIKYVSTLSQLSFIGRVNPHHSQPYVL